MNDNSYNNNLEGLDILTIASFIMQAKNIEADKVQNKYVKDNIERIETELNKINIKLDKILEKIGDISYGPYC